MKLIISSIFFLLLPVFVPAQKKTIDTSVLATWPDVRGGMLSHDGRFFAYTLTDYRAKAIFPTSLIFTKVGNGDIIRTIPGASSFNFTAAGDLAVLLKPQNILCKLNLDNGHSEDIPGVSAYRLFRNKTWLAYDVAESKELHLQNLITNTDKTVAGVASYLLNEDETAMVIAKNAGNDVQELYWMPLQTGKLNKIWEGKAAGNFICKSNHLLAFLSGQEGDRTVWYYDQTSMKAATMVFEKAPPQFGTGISVDGLIRFSEDGRKLFLKLAQVEPAAGPKIDMAKLDVWSYTDASLQSEQTESLKVREPRKFLAVADIANQSVVQLEKENERVDFFNDEIALSLSFGASNSEKYWSRLSRYITRLISVRDVHVLTTIEYPIGVSPQGRYFIYFDRAFKNCYSYDIQKGETKNLTGSLPIPGTDDAFDLAGTRGELSQTLEGPDLCWLKDDKGFVIYDKFDLWLLDPSGKAAPLNLTRGYGRKHHISFGIARSPGILNGKDNLLLSAVDNDTRENGFFSVSLGSNTDPEKLSMGPYHYNLRELTEMKNGRPVNPLNDYPLAYTVLRESAESAPNYYLTRDFRSYLPLTNVHPESDYNWLTSELISYKGRDGYPLQAALFKPENFDPAKKYPVIIQYYEKRADAIHRYEAPALFSDEINIPWTVSNGYIVVEPDIHYKLGETGKSALSAVEGVADYIKQLPFVDSARIGIKGHSFGGFETDYIVTHSRLFAAAVSSSGMSDLISDYGSLWGHNGSSKQEINEIDQTRMGATLWDKPGLYIENSAVFRAADVNTPLLMMNNKEDGAVSFSQGLEFFIALRRLGKKAWMLAYDGESHSLVDKKAELDYTRRVMQFFDHYLKGKPAPIWMTRGISADQKGTVDGFAYDHFVTTPPASPLIDPGKDPRLIYPGDQADF